MEAAVIAVAHPKWTERPLLVVVPAPGSNLSRGDLLKFLQVSVPYKSTTLLLLSQPMPVMSLCHWWASSACCFAQPMLETLDCAISKEPSQQPVNSPGRHAQLLNRVAAITTIAYNTIFILDYTVVLYNLSYHGSPQVCFQELRRHVVLSFSCNSTCS